MIVSEAVVSVLDERWSKGSERPQRLLSAATHGPGFSRAFGNMYRDGEIVASIELREDGWLVVDRTGYADGELDLFAPHSISLVRVSKKELEAAARLEIAQRLEGS